MTLPKVSQNILGHDTLIQKKFKINIDIDIYILNEIQMYTSLERVDKIAYWDIKSISYLHF